MFEDSNQKIVLSIMIVTMNRKSVLLRALQSCVECNLPDKTEFVIVDNASQDGTQEAVTAFFSKNPYEYFYCPFKENVGPAKGRNEGLRIARGRFVYFIDDDAYVDRPKEFFFEKMISFLLKNENVFCITTSIYDCALKNRRSVVVSKNKYIDQYRRILMFHGGSFIIDKQKLLYQDKLFLADQFWGMEELYPSIEYYFHDRFIIEMNDISIIHDPVDSPFYGENKIKNPKENYVINMRFDRKKSYIFHFSSALKVKLIFYPIAFYPIILVLFGLRIVRYIGLRTLFEQIYILFSMKIKKETIPFSSFLSFAKEFGFRSIL